MRQLYKNSQIQTIRENVTRACDAHTCNVSAISTTTTTPVDCGKRPAKTPPSQLRSGQPKKRNLVVDQLVKSVEKLKVSSNDTEEAESSSTKACRKLHFVSTDHSYISQRTYRLCQRNILTFQMTVC